MPGHTPEQWRELHKRVAALIADPATPGDKRRLAENVMGMIRRNPEAMDALRAPAPQPPLTELGWTEDLI